VLPDSSARAASIRSSSTYFAGGMSKAAAKRRVKLRTLIAARSASSSTGSARPRFCAIHSSSAAKRSPSPARAWPARRGLNCDCPPWRLR